MLENSFHLGSLRVSVLGNLFRPMISVLFDCLQVINELNDQKHFKDYGASIDYL